MDLQWIADTLSSAEWSAKRWMTYRRHLVNVNRAIDG